MNDELTAEDHLLRVIALCQLPKEDWTSSDRKQLDAARKFIQTKKEEKSLEDRDEKRSRKSAEPSGKEQDGPKVGSEVSKDVDALEERAQDTAKTRSE